MPILAKTHIHINGNKLPYYNKCSLHQEIGEHHIMELHCLLETIQKFCNDNSQEIEELLGSIITIETKSYADIDFHGMLKFKGIVTGLNYRKGLYASNGDFIIIKALSPTIIADDGPHHTSYNEKSFKDIMKANFSNYDSSKLKINTSNSNLSESILYTVQYNESCFRFAQRMASRNGEWLYYNGEELVFGIDSDTEELEIVLGRDLQDFNTSLTPIPQNFNYLTNDYLTDELHESPSSSSNSVTEGVYGILNNSSNEIYTNPTNVWINSLDDTDARNRLDQNVTLQQNALQTNQLIVSGTADNPGIQIGVVIKISQNNYRVTSVTHSYSNNGEYENYFEAISTNIDAYPKTNINAFPMAQSQTAVIKENHDPDGMGRVKVQFQWQRDKGLITPWIRLVSLNAGSGKGMYSIPKIEEEVIANFEGGNAEIPYVFGCLFNANNKPPVEINNPNIFFIITNEGNKIIINDGDNTVTIIDQSGSKIVFNGGDITLEATANINLIALNGEINFNSPKINIGSEDSTPDLTNIHGKKIHIHASQLLELISDAELTATGKNTTLDGTVSNTIHGATVSVSGDAITEIKGGQVKMN